MQAIRNVSQMLDREIDDEKSNHYFTNSLNNRMAETDQYRISPITRSCTCGALMQLLLMRKQLESYE